MTRPVIKLQATRAIAKSQEMVRDWLKAYGCINFSQGERDGMPFIAFELPINGGEGTVPILYKIRVDNYAQTLLDRNPWTTRKQKSQEQWESETREQAERSAWSLVADKLAADLSLVELQLQTLADVFLSKMATPDGVTVGECFSVDRLIQGKQPLLLPGK